MLVEKASEILTDRQQSLHRRAIELYGFQVAILSPDTPRLECDARILAGLKILERLESELPKTASLKQRLNLAGYAGVLDAVLVEDGARGLRSAWSTKDFSEQVSIRLDEAHDVARMVRFSHRFAEHGNPTARQKGGPTMARYIIHEMNNLSESTLKTRWKEYGRTAVLQYLMFYHYKKLKPKRLSTKNFIERLFAQAQDLDALRAFFDDYWQLARVLRPRGYTFESQSVRELMSRSFELKPFSEEEIQIIDSYRS